ncbi:hypothetical protein NPIL_507141 [Nephila pilipes]|uniref:Uncharacterized protein n=1 Tax=Nephila pilipes TaxID=299642 RepID=A0A8X6QNN6_NEPPI|nr:hypothetical protein NPIL_507141 [Nephila pilipes]
MTPCKLSERSYPIQTKSFPFVTPIPQSKIHLMKFTHKRESNISFFFPEKKVRTPEINNAPPHVSVTLFLQNYSPAEPQRVQRRIAQASQDHPMPHPYG